MVTLNCASFRSGSADTPVESSGSTSASLAAALSSESTQIARFAHSHAGASHQLDKEPVALVAARRSHLVPPLTRAATRTRKRLSRRRSRSLAIVADHHSEPPSLVLGGDARPGDAIGAAPTVLQHPHDVVDALAAVIHHHPTRSTLDRGLDPLGPKLHDPDRWSDCIATRGS